MPIQIVRPLLALILLALSSLSFGAGARVVELFTSHGCSSCPPADELLSDLIRQDPDLVALEFHVDYWNDLVHGSSGNWVDPFSSEANTRRQYRYNQSQLAGRKGVYTPQMIVNGEYAAVGSDRRRITSALQDVRSGIDIRVSRTENDQLNIEWDKPLVDQARLWLVIYDVKRETAITGGENKDLVITNHHIVKAFKPLDELERESTSLSVPVTLADGEGCAVLVQSDNPGPVLGAANCPML